MCASYGQIESSYNHFIDDKRKKLGFLDNFKRIGFLVRKGRMKEHYQTKSAKDLIQRHGRKLFFILVVVGLVALIFG